jgi:hypothetical protein
MDNQVRQNTIPPGERETNLEAANWAYKKRVKAFRDWLDANGTAEGQKKFTELFGERDA